MPTQAMATNFASKSTTDLEHEFVQTLCTSKSAGYSSSSSSGLNGHFWGIASIGWFLVPEQRACRPKQEHVLLQQRLPDWKERQEGTTIHKWDVIWYVTSTSIIVVLGMSEHGWFHHQQEGCNWDDMMGCDTTQHAFVAMSENGDSPTAIKQ